MTDERKIELFDNLLTWIWAHTEGYGKIEYVTALENIGYTPEEIQEELQVAEFDDDTIDDFGCPLGGDETNDCEGCAYSCDYHFVNGECVRRD